MRDVSDEVFERLWRICHGLVERAGARAALLCDSSSGTLLVSVGDASAEGAPETVESLGAGERVVHGAPGEMFGVEVAGGALLAVLHDRPALERVRSEVAQVVEALGLLLQAAPERREPEEHDHAAYAARAREASRAAKSKPKSASRAKAKQKPASRSKAKQKPAARSKAKRKPAARKSGQKSAALRASPKRAARGPAARRRR